MSLMINNRGQIMEEDGEALTKLKEDYAKLQEFTETLGQKLIYVEEKLNKELEHTSNSYLQECEKNSRLQNQLEALEVQVDTMKGKIRINEDMKQGFDDVVKLLNEEMNEMKKKQRITEDELGMCHMRISDLKLKIYEQTGGQGEGRSSRRNSAKLERVMQNGAGESSVSPSPRRIPHRKSSLPCIHQSRNLTGQDIKSPTMSKTPDLGMFLFES